MAEVELEIPSYFLCPISLQLMKDPVTLSTGISFDRDSIEQWIFARRRQQQQQMLTCPVTRRPLNDSDLTPNHTLRRLIQAWCSVNSSNGVERLPTPRPPVDHAQIAELLGEAKQPQLQLVALRKLRAIVAESERNKRLVEATPGAVNFLASVVASQVDGVSIQEEEADGFESTSNAGEEALCILHAIEIAEQDLLDLVAKNAGLVESLTAVLRRSNYQSRAQATLLLKTIVGVLSYDQLASLGEELFHEIVTVVRDRISQQATKAALHVLVAACPIGRNRIKSARAGAVHVAIELLMEEDDRRVCELALAAVERACGCAEGRAALVSHAAGVAAVAKKVLRVSEAASERAVKALHAVAKHAATPGLLQDMLHVGVVAKLCLVLQAECSAKTKEKAREILRVHARAWRCSACLSPQFKLAYPS